MDQKKGLKMRPDVHFFLYLYASKDAENLIQTDPHRGLEPFRALWILRSTLKPCDKIHWLFKPGTKPSVWFTVLTVDHNTNLCQSLKSRNEKYFIKWNKQTVYHQQNLVLERIKQTQHKNGSNQERWKEEQRCWKDALFSINPTHDMLWDVVKCCSSAAGRSWSWKATYVFSYMSTSERLRPINQDNVHQLSKRIIQMLLDLFEYQ